MSSALFFVGQWLHFCLFTSTHCYYCCCGVKFAVIFTFHSFIVTARSSVMLCHHKDVCVSGKIVEKSRSIQKNRWWYRKKEYKLSEWVFDYWSTHTTTMACYLITHSYHVSNMLLFFSLHATTLCTNEK